MSRSVKIDLSQDQCDALAIEAQASGLSFFNHCRAKLLAGLNQPLQPQPVRTPITAKAAPAPSALPPTDPQAGRMDRLEAIMMQLAETVQAAIANPIQYPADAPGYATEAAIDVDDVVGNVLADAERHVLAVEREPAPRNAGGVRHVGTRAPAPFSAGQGPRHLQNLMPGG